MPFLPDWLPLTAIAAFLGFGLGAWNAVQAWKAKESSAEQKQLETINRIRQNLCETVRVISEDAQSYWSRDGADDPQRERIEWARLTSKGLHLQRILEGGRDHFSDKDYSEINTDITNLRQTVTRGNFGDKEGRSFDMSILAETNRISDSLYLRLADLSKL